MSGVKRYSEGRFSRFGEEHPQGCWIKASDYDALAQQLVATQEDRKQWIADVDRLENEARVLRQQLADSRVKVGGLEDELAASDKHLSKAVFLLKEAWKGAEDGEVPSIVRTFLTTIEQAKAND